MVKKVLFLGLTFMFALSGLSTLVKTDDKAEEEIQVNSSKGKDDDLKGRPDTEEGVMFLSLNTFNLK